MNIFDKICAVLAGMIAIFFLFLGVLGLFNGCKASFTLPPILGFLPALVGWGILRPIYLAWKRRPAPRDKMLDPPDAAPL